MVVGWLLAQAPTDPGGGWGYIIPLTTVVAAAATVVATAILNRRKGKGDFTSEVLKEMEYYKAKTHSLEKKLAEKDHDILVLNDQCRMLGQENARLVRAEHQEVLERLEALITRAEVSRVGVGGSDKKLDEIHALVNDRLDKALNEIEALKLTISGKERT
jgi:hypothetical protein